MGHTKTAISLPDEVFAQLEKQARSEGTPRSAIVARALQDYFDSQDTAEFIKQTDEAWDSLSPEEIAEIRTLSAISSRDVSRTSLRGEAEPWPS